MVPEFVKACVEYVEAEGLATEGLYRVPGSRAHVDMLMDSFRGGKFSILDYVFKTFVKVQNGCVVEIYIVIIRVVAWCFIVVWQEN